MCVSTRKQCGVMERRCQGYILQGRRHGRGSEGHGSYEVDIDNEMDVEIEVAYCDPDSLAPGRYDAVLYKRYP
jgi:hypothetical protein